MSTLIFRLRHVPEDEAQAIRDLLSEHAIDWYETSAGNWGIAMPGLWVADDSQIDTAKGLIDTYQQEHSATQRHLHEQQKRLGQHTTLWQRLVAHPFRAAGIVAFCLFILYVSIHPFIQMITFSSSS